MEKGLDSENFNQTVSSLQSPALACTAPYEYYIHEIVYAVGRSFNFQAFNLNPTNQHAQGEEQDWVPASIFVASDHLVNVLAKNMYTRNPLDVDARHRFLRATWDLHGKMMQNYYKWCDHVGLPCRPQQQQDWFNKAEPYADDVCYLLVSELALFYCLWTEGHNMRYCPELLNFLYWTMRFSSHFERAARLTPDLKADIPEVPTDPEQIVPNIRQYREELRKAYWVQIMKLKEKQEKDSVQPTSQLIHQYTGIDPNNAFLLAEIIENGDGGKFLDNVTQPIFHFLALELDQKGGKNGVETVNRINYDDVNESMTNSKLIKSTLRKLGFAGTKLKEVNGAFDEIMKLPYEEDGSTHNMEKAADWWRANSFAKTFRERRSYFQIFRMFWRLFAFHTVLFHELLIIALYGFKEFSLESCNTSLLTSSSEEVEGEEKERFCGKISGFIAAHSSCLITHCFLVVIERFAAGYLSCGTNDPSKKTEKRKQKRKMKYHDLEQAETEQLNDEIKQKKKKIRPPTIRIEGKPIFVYGEFIAWLLFFVLMCTVFVLQFLKPKSIGVSGLEKDDFKLYWIFLSCGYFILTLAHAVLSTRDGYQISLTSYLSNGLLRNFSIRGKPLNEVTEISKLKISWRLLAWNIFFWVPTLCLKGLFDYYFIMDPLANGLKALAREKWLDNIFPDNLEIPQTGLHFPKDGDVILMIVRAIPSFCITIVDTSVFYMFTAVTFGMLRGLVLLNLGVVGNFYEVQNEFRRVPKQWWQKCISEEGKRNIRECLSRNRNLLPEEDDNSIPEEDTENSKKKKKDKKKNKKTSLIKASEPEGEAKYDVFSTTWNEIINNLREADLISNDERDNLVYLRVEWHDSLYEHKIKPLLGPVFTYAGQLQKAVEVSKPNKTQMYVLRDVRDVLLYLLCQMDMIDKDFAETLKSVFLLTEPFDRHHRISRRNFLKSVISFLQSLSNLSKQNPSEESAWKKEVEQVKKALENVCEELWNELMALRDHKKTKRLKLRGRVLNDNISTIERFVKHMKTEFLAKEKEGVLERNLVILSKQNSMESSDNEDNEAGNKAPQDLLLKLINGLIKRLTTTRVVATPNGKEARQFITFFVTSLFNPQLKTPPALANMMSWTTMVPVYAEDIIYAIEQKETARVCGLDAKKKSDGKFTDLLTETDTRVCILAYLKSVYPKDWINFLERMKDKHGIEYDKPDEVSGDDFLEGNQYFKIQNDLLLWASYRGQLLSRTVRGMMVYEKALKLIALLEHPRPEDMLEDDYNFAIEEVVTTKFRCIIAAQIYGSNRIGSKLKQKWDAKAIELLLHLNPTLRVSFIDAIKNPTGPMTQFVVLIRGSPGGSDGENKSPVEEVYRIRCPYNLYTGRGIVIGEGKPENQNHAICFAFGETLQTIDMNQDNFLLEAMKMRSLLQELKTTEYMPKKHIKTCKEYTSKILKKLDRKYTKKPILVGFREWIFSGKAGALGSFAAGTEFAFGTILQRVMTFPGRARFHYGHPDVWDKLFIMPRGGISKATRNLHVSEDVFGGFNAALRGGKIAYRDYISVGKGRDMGFVSINGFEIKISGGNGEVCISRDLYRIATRTDFFRMMSVYYSGPGFFINNAILMTTVFLQAWVLAVLALAGAYLVESGKIQESEGILYNKDELREQAVKEAAEEEGGRRLLFDAHDRSLKQVGYYGYSFDSYSDQEPAEPAEETNEDPPPEEEEEEDYTPNYLNYYISQNNDGSGGGGTTTTTTTTDEQSYGTGDGDDQYNPISSYYDNFNNINSDTTSSYYDNIAGTDSNTNSGSSSSGGSSSGGSSNQQTSSNTNANQNLSESDVEDYILNNTQNFYLRNVDTSVEISSIVQLGMLTVIAYIGELLLELGLLQTIVIIFLQVLSGSLAFFIFKQQTDAAAFLEDMNYGGARYVGTGREFALMHNPFVTLYVRYARTHFYFAFNLVLLSVMLLILGVPGYGSATFGSWMVAVSLIAAPFWFNPVQFVLSQTKADYKQFNRWLQGEEKDPDSNDTWYTWHDKQMAKIRNENHNITDHWLNSLRSVLWSLIINGILAISSISQIRTTKDYDIIDNYKNREEEIKNEMVTMQNPTVGKMDLMAQELNQVSEKRMRAENDKLGIASTNSLEKFRLWAIVTLVLLTAGSIFFLIYSWCKKTGKSKGARVIRVLAAVFFIFASIILAQFADWIQTDDSKKNGWRNLMLIYYANWNLLVFFIQFLEHTFFDNVPVRHAVDKAYLILDSFLGIILFGILFILSFTGLMSIIQNTLLYNVSVARSIQRGELVETIGIERLKGGRDDSEDGDNRNSNPVGDALERLTDPNRSMDSSMLVGQREGSFTRGDSFIKKGASFIRSRESSAIAGRGPSDYDQSGHGRYH